MKINIVLLNLVFFSVLIISSCSKETPEELLMGKWETTDRTKESIVSTIEFSEGNKVVVGNELKMDYNYKYQGNGVLIMSHSDSTVIYSFLDTIQVTLRNDTLIQKKIFHGQPENVIWVRKEKAKGKNDIEGTWQREVMPEIVAHITFTDYGIAKYRIPSKQKEGTYMINKDETLTMVFPSTTYHEQAFTVTKDTLTFWGRKPGQFGSYIRAVE